MVRQGLLSTHRNFELLLLIVTGAFVLLAYESLDRSPVELPVNADRIFIQFTATVIAGHVALRVLCPKAPAQVYAIAMMLAAIGLVFVMRLAPEEAPDQANWITFGVVLMSITLAAGRRYELLRRYKYSAAFLALVLLFVTGVFGTTINGARLWLTFGGVTVQTTELIKVGLIVFLASYLADEASVLSMPKLRVGNRSYSALPYLLPLLATWFATIAALALLRDLGSVAILLLLGTAALYIATGRAMYVVVGVILVAATGALGYMLFDHAQVRIDTWLNPLDSPLGAGYQSSQAMFAIQAGGVTGEGIGMGSPDIIPAAPTDYIYSAIAEELGLIGAATVVLLFAMLVIAGMRIALLCREPFGRMLAATVSLLIGIQAVVIIAGNLRLIPTTGITLPLVSYGGSSIVVNMVLLGLLLAIAERASRRT
jgi:cell division protein FtsW (lipid II flippase)